MGQNITYYDGERTKGRIARKLIIVICGAPSYIHACLNLNTSVELGALRARAPTQTSSTIRGAEPGTPGLAEASSASAIVPNKTRPVIGDA